MPAAQRHVVTPNNDTIYGAGFADLTTDAVVIQTPIDAPPGHYWTIQFVDLFTTVIHQLGSASATPGGKFLLVGPEWKGQRPRGFIDVLHSPTNVTGVFGRSFAARTPEAKAKARAVLNQIGMYPFSENDERPQDLRLRGQRPQQGVSTRPHGRDPRRRSRSAAQATRGREHVLGPIEKCAGRESAGGRERHSHGRAGAHAARAARIRCLLARAARSRRADGRCRIACHRPVRPGRRRRRQWLAASGERRHLGRRLVRPRGGGDHLHLRQRLSRGYLLRPRHRLEGRPALSAAMATRSSSRRMRCRPWTGTGVDSGR